MGEKSTRKIVSRLMELCLTRHGHSLNKNLPACSSPNRVFYCGTVPIRSLIPRENTNMASVVSVIVGLIIMACAFAGLIVAADECTRHP